MKYDKPIKIAAATTMMGAAVFLLVHHFQKTDDADGTTLWICLHEATPHEFSVSIRQVESMTKSGGQIYCPIHDSDEVSMATHCPSCNAPVTMGLHGITPEFCWKCDAKLPNGGFDLFHAGVH